MLFLEAEAGWLVVVHAIIGFATVFAATHLVVWLRGWRAGRAPRLAGARRFAWLMLAGYAASFTLGNLVYPVYKARVRVEYLENPPAIAAALRERASTSAAMAEFTGGVAIQPGARDEVARLARLARWFDVKEHGVLVGLLLAIAVCAVLAVWDPSRGGGGPLVLIRGGALACALLAWSAAIIGLLVGAARAVG